MLRLPSHEFLVSICHEAVAITEMTVHFLYWLLAHQNKITFGFR